MLSKLLSLLSTAKGAAAATAIAAAAVSTGVAATDQDVRDAVTNTIHDVTESADAKDAGQPAVVTARNKADSDLRAAFHTNQQSLEKLHSTHVGSTDRATLESTIKTADDALRAELTKALDKAATMTIGREGRESSGAQAAPDIKVAFTAQAELDAWVTSEITAMNLIEQNAETAVAALPTFTPGKPADAGKPDNAGKPAELPAHP